MASKESRAATELCRQGLAVPPGARHATGVEVRVDVFPEQQHTFQMMAGRVPEAGDTTNRFAQWLRPRHHLA